MTEMHTFKCAQDVPVYFSATHPYIMYEGNSTCGSRTFPSNGVETGPEPAACCPRRSWASCPTDPAACRLSSVLEGGAADLDRNGSI